MCHVEPPLTFSACKVVPLGESTRGCLSAPKKIDVKLHVNRGHASAQRLRRVLEDSDGDDMHFVTCVDGVLAKSEVFRAFDTAPHAPAAGSSTVAMFYETLQVDLFFFGGIVALHIMDVFSKYA